MYESSPGIETEKQGGWRFISWHWLVLHFLFSKRFELFIQIIHLLPLLWASCDNLVGIEPLTLSYRLCVFSLLSCLKVMTHPHDLNLLVVDSCGIPAGPMLCLLEAASCPRGSEESITNSFEISSFQLWLPSADHTLSSNSCNIFTDYSEITFWPVAQPSSMIPWLPDLFTRCQSDWSTDLYPFIHNKMPSLKGSVKCPKGRFQRKPGTCERVSELSCLSPTWKVDLFGYMKASK